MDNNEFNYFENTGYINKRNRKRTLILDVDDSGTGDTHLGDGGEFNIELFEPLVIDKHSEVYLDNFLSFNSNIGQTPSTSAFVLKINEFNMNSNVASSSNNNNIFNSLVIPNEHKSVINNHSAIIHKGKKFNYVCDINPQTISSLSGKITSLTGGPMFHGTQTTNVFTYALTGITSGNIDRLINSGETFSEIRGGNDPGSALLVDLTGAFLATHLTTATTLHFSANRDIHPNEITSHFSDGAGDITFTTGSGISIVITNGIPPNDNPNLNLVTAPGGFIAEFSIISRE
tara:strand:- start:938 stop:1801 length:864 start_codon:yes stop_codon:yes gene_type:complete